MHDSHSFRSPMLNKVGGVTLTRFLEQLVPVMFTNKHALAF